MQQPAFPPYHPQNKGTLVPGQTVTINKYTVQVEKYLSQGGFSHVYLVRTPTPVYNTTHHVLKRIAVANEVMLADVKKEVDIMTILKGHPNIVYLIDAAWHRMPNGQYEVFILMEFCQGGGIIDMMNRRLRERLTEAEILQIFVDVCEGVALMHNLRPPLLHRDLKVENILQSSTTTFKLCDFGSATPVAPRPPTTTQEIKALEADLNRHTTLQYRAPEMIDPYLRRPVDEKSDVWALGVLLYKLCFYTTPFEEQGPLAILNVHYRTPPYPVYSPQLQHLIASMLREHGTQRPTVFSLLDQVHHMRGTKSRFTYHTPSPQPLSPRVQEPPNSIDSVPSRSRPSNPTPQVPPGQYKDVTPGVQAREKVLEANTPLRRGRPSGHQKDGTVSRPPSPPTRLPAPTKRDLLEDEEDKAWKALKDSAQGSGDLRLHKSGGAGWSAWKPRNVVSGGTGGESSKARTTGVGPLTPSATFGDSFAEKLWNAHDGTRPSPTAGGPTTSKVKLTPSKLAPPLEGSRNTKLVVSRGRDAFDGLGLPISVSQPPTLGEARKLRTGLAAVGEYHRGVITPNPSLAAANSPSLQRTSPRPSLSRAGLSWKSSPSMQPASLSAGKLPESTQPHDLSVESRFPSLEELDATFSPSVHTSHSSSRVDQPSEKGKTVDLSESFQPLRPHRPTPSSLSQNSIRPEQVPSNAARETKTGQSQRHLRLQSVDDATLSTRLNRQAAPQSSSSGKRPASLLVQPSATQQPDKLVDIVGSSTFPSPQPMRAHEPKDWLTGDVDGQLSPIKVGTLADVDKPETPVLREFTKKRSSFIEENTVHIPSPQEGITGRQSSPGVTTPVLPTKSSVIRQSQERNLNTATIAFEGAKEPVVPSLMPALGYSRPLDRFQSATTGTTRLPLEVGKHALPEPSPDGRTSSSDEDSPEDAIGMTSKLTERGSARRRRGRQSSVHDLVDLWGGGVVQTKERLKDEPQDVMVRGVVKEVGANLRKSRSIAAPSATKGRASSPQRFLARPADISGAAEVVRLPSGTSGQPSPALHTKQVSAPNTSTSIASARPQSLIVFPVSKSVSDGKLDTSTPTSGLSVPQDESRKDGSRRTSITQMVQRYEAINVNTKAAGSGTSSLLPKPTGSKVAPQITSLATGARPVQSSLNSPRAGFSRPADHPPPTKDMEKRPTFKNPVDQLSAPTGLPNSMASKVSSSSSGRPGQIDGLPLPSPAHKVIALPENQRRSPSPEKPYRGVGKLIDQWQKKSEEAGSTQSPVPRRGYVAKRAGLVSGNVQG